MGQPRATSRLPTGRRTQSASPRGGCLAVVRGAICTHVRCVEGAQTADRVRGAVCICIQNVDGHALPSTSVSIHTICVFPRPRALTARSCFSSCVASSCTCTICTLHILHATRAQSNPRRRHVQDEQHAPAGGSHAHTGQRDGGDAACGGRRNELCERLRVSRAGE